jgi:tRNA(Ile)-lysidine synthase
VSSGQTNPEEETGAGALIEAINSSGLVAPGSGGVVLVSGGPDSSALLFGLASVVDPSRLLALHLNYRLRPDSDRDEAAARLLAKELGVEFAVERPESEPGNLHDWARRARYGAAERLRAERELDWIAVAHTLTDRAETVLYRLAVAPGARALAAMPDRQGRIIRPLISLERDQVHQAAAAAGLSWVEDPSNLDPGFARTRVREEILPVLRELNPAAVANIDRTRSEVAGQLDALSQIAAGSLVADEQGEVVLEADALLEMAPALARQALRVLASERLGRPVTVPEEGARQAVSLAAKPGGGEVQLPGGVSLLIEGGVVLATEAGRDESFPGELSLEVPGTVTWGEWTIAATIDRPPLGPSDPGLAALDADAVGELAVRAWQSGDRMRPLGLGGSRTVQDLFTDAGMRRSLRRRHPLVMVDQEVAWIPGVAVADPFRVTERTSRVIRLTANRKPAGNRSS